ncbi:MAG: ATPase [Caulobacterales bacterium 68-7]|nr:SRPBCC domain-containing protein [Caulobacterales bacterium]OJU10371.1 MAG: ATPase [Caulobacterales bacterium 68-7]
MTDTALMPETRNIVVDETVPHAPDVIWRALTDGDLIGRWLMAPRGFAPVVGTEFTYQTTPGGAWDGVIHCKVLEVVAERRLAYAWKGGHPDNVTGYGAPLDTIVAFTLTPGDGGTRVQLVHSGFVLPRNAGAHENMGKGWRQIVPRLGEIAGEA